ncbi:MAG: hypothetical protein ACE5NP_00810 [Anaerolineae bacterium]
MRRVVLFLSLLLFSFCLSGLIILAILLQTPYQEVVAPTPTPTSLVPTPTPSPSPIPTIVPGRVSPEDLSTLEKLLQAQVPERDLWALMLRLKKPAGPMQRVVNEVPPQYQVGQRETFWIADQESKEHFRTTAVLRHITPHLYLWVEEGYEVDEEDLARSAERFEEHIYPTNRQFFGSEWTPGVDNDVHLHIFNGRVPGVAGYYSSADEFPRVVNPFSNEREIFYVNLDSIRPGEDLYEAILAHEFQHMIHWNTDKNEDTWVNEGLSELAVQLSGYTPLGSERIFARSPDTQLNAWSDDPPATVPHYGASYLFMAYSLERFGENFVRQIVSSPANGIEGFDQVLMANDTGLTFDDIFKDWLMANYLDRPDLGGGRYGYEGLDIQVSLSQQHGSYPVQERSTVHQYAADYIKLEPPEEDGDLVIEFKGGAAVKLVDNKPHSGQFQWWSNRGDSSDMTLTRAFDLTDLDEATLEVWLWYNIEQDYDYAYIEVSTNGGQTWDILQGSYTTDANPNGNNFGHGYTGRSGVEEQEPEADTSNNTPQWVKEMIDLSPYAGHEILLRFEYLTDDAYNAPGFVVDDIAIPELGYFDDGEEGDGGWVAEGFIRSNNVIPQDYAVQVIELGPEIRVRQMRLDDDRTGRWIISGFGQEVEQAVLVIAALAPVSTELATYEYSLRPVDHIDSEDQP